MEGGKDFILVLFLLSTLSAYAHHPYFPSEKWNKSYDDSQGPEKSWNHPVTLTLHDNYAIINNGILQLILSIPEGHVIAIQYGKMKNVLQSLKISQRGYWDIFWNTAQNKGAEWLHMKKFRVIKEDENQVEVSFSSQWNGYTSIIPLNMDKRYIMLRGSSGFYNYVILQHGRDFPAVNISQIRVAYKPRADKFRYMVVSDDIQKVMPSEEDYSNGHTLAYREAILWTNYSSPSTITQVEDKYQYSEDIKEQRVHGWISSNPRVGFWIITPTTEFYSTSPFKQQLTSHFGPTSLIAFFGGHYIGEYLQISLKNGETWNKVFGPYFVHLNKVSSNGDPYNQLWDMAKKQAQLEIEKWPYSFPSSEVYSKADQRGTVTGRLLVRDGRMNVDVIPANSAWVGLSAPGEAGSWQTETKGYQFWTRADNYGKFVVKGVLPGVYSLYAWVPGFIGDYKYSSDIFIQPGSYIDLDELVYEPPRDGPTLWEIGIPDRSAAEFFVPDPRPDLTNSAFLNNTNTKYRQYGLWDRYTDLYPDHDLVYTVGSSDYKKDWFFAHVPRQINSQSYQSTTWQVRFTLDNQIRPYEHYTLRIALASASAAVIQVRFNGFIPRSRAQYIRTPRVGWDNAVARHGIHGIYWLFSFEIPGFMLENGMNTLYLTQADGTNQFCGAMYDYIRLEGPMY